MARLGRILPAVVVTSGNPDSVNDAPVTATTVGSAYDLSGQLGAVLLSADGSREWIYAKISSTATGTALAANQPCYWVGNSTANMATPGAWVVDNNTTANTGTSVGDLAGVLRVAATRGNYVFLMRKSGTNYIPIVGTSTIGVPGDPVVASTTSSASATTISSTTTVLGTAPGFIGRPQFGWIGSTSTAPAYVGSTATGGTGANISVLLAIQ